jgi:hypothetical protein
VVTPAVNPNRLDPVGLGSLFASFLATVGLNVFIIAKLVGDPDLELSTTSD